jgi:hypothetical protein
MFFKIFENFLPHGMCHNTAALKYQIILSFWVNEYPK